MISQTLPTGWRLMRLESLVETVRGVTFSAAEATYESAADRIACLTTSGVQDEVNWTSRRYIPRRRVERDDAMLRSGDILVSTANSKDLVGKSCLVEEVPFECTFGAFVTVVRPGELTDPYLLAKYLRTDFAQAYLYAKSSQTTNISNLRTGDLLALEIPLPPLPEQRRIVAILHQADDLRRERREIDEQAKQLLPALFHEIFGDPYLNPKGWETCKLGELIVVGPQNGLYKPASDYGDGTPILRIDGFYDGKVIDMNALQRLRASPSEIDDYRLNQNDIVINRVNSPEYLGKSALIPEPSEATVYESNMMRFAVDTEQLNPVYLMQLLQTSEIKRQIIRKAKHAINQSSINQQDVKQLQILRPPKPLQDSFASHVQLFQSIAGERALGSHEIDELLQSILARAFTGELTASWREAHLEELRQTAEERDRLLTERGRAITPSSVKPEVVEVAAEPDVTHPRYALLRELSPAQYAVYQAAQAEYRNFTAYSLANWHNVDLDVALRTLPLLATMGLIRHISTEAASSEETDPQQPTVTLRRLTYVPVYRALHAEDDSFESRDGDRKAIEAAFPDLRT